MTMTTASEVYALCAACERTLPVGISAARRTGGTIGLEFAGMVPSTRKLGNWLCLACVRDGSAAAAMLVREAGRSE